MNMFSEFRPDLANGILETIQIVAKTTNVHHHLKIFQLKRYLYKNYLEIVNRDIMILPCCDYQKTLNIYG